MYNYDDLGAFASPETRLKQLLLKLKEQEKANSELKSQVQSVRTEMTNKNSKDQKQKATEINNNLESLMRDINGLVQENLALKEQQGVPTAQTAEVRTRISQHLFQTQKALGVENSKILKIPTGRASMNFGTISSSNYDSRGSPKFAQDVADRGVLSGGPSSMRSSVAGGDFRKMFTLNKQRTAMGRESGDDGDSVSSHTSGGSTSSEEDPSKKMQEPVSTIIMSYTRKKKRDDDHL